MDPNHSFPSSSSSWLSGFPGAAAVPGANISFDLIPIDEDDDAAGVAPSRSGPAPRQEREPMFEKSLTPSDVGKLNRLVIPKQHAERHFPLGGGGGGGDKGLLLCFEDDGGKLWRFRYSYWSSSQSYVLTKGWSRFVKEKRLDAGDVVLFDRHRRDGSRLFIGWKRRAAAAAPDRRANPGARGGFYPAHPYPAHPQPYPHQPDPHYLHAGSAVAVQIPAAVAVPATGSPKRLRLFGVNMECQPGLGFGSDGSSGAGGPSHGGAHSQLYAHMYAADPSPSGGSFYTDMNFGPDVKMT